jgi:glycerophosphoryl diester phosphodiesterase
MTFPRRPLIFGHRGSMATHPENTLPGFLHAIACGADGVELDVAVTRDDVLLVTHDLALKDGRVVREHRAADLPLPSLDDVLRIASPETFWFDIEAKGAQDLERYAQLLSEAIRRAPIPHRVLVRSFDHALLRDFHVIEPNIQLAALIDYDSDAWPAIAREAKASIISPHYSAVTAPRMRKSHDENIAVSTWTVNRAKDWDRLAEMEVDVLITDDPAKAVTHFAV